jgi:5-methyltetrahydrofolate--homocysteine methyltransferase
LREINCASHIFVGGAVVTEELAREINADYYTADALQMVSKLEELTR